MNVRLPAGDLTLGYEALRAQATGQLPATTPRGLALFLTQGCPAWMQAWLPVASAPCRERQAASDRQTPVRVEVVQLLTEMALSCQKRWATA